MRRPRLMIGGIASLDEAMLAVEAGADLVGIEPRASSGADEAGSGAMEVGERAAEICRRLPLPVAGVVASDAWSAGSIAAQVDLSGAAVIALRRPIEPDDYPGLRRILRGRRLLQVLALDGPHGLDAALAYAALADGLLLIRAGPGAEGSPLSPQSLPPQSLPPQALWPVARQVVERSPVPVFLDESLAGADAAAALVALRPAGLAMAFPRQKAGRHDAARLETMARLICG